MYDEEYHEKIKTPKELYEAIRLELKWNGPFAFTFPGDPISELIQIAMRVRAENLPLDLGDVPTRCTVPDIQNWCINAQKVMDVAAAKSAEIPRGANAEATASNTAEATPPQIRNGEAPVRIQTAIGNLPISHSRVKQAAKKGEIESQRAGAKKNSPYLVFKSEVEWKFGPHGAR